MPRITNNNLKRALSQWMLAIVMLAGFFAGYASNLTGEPRHKIQTEWVADQRSSQTKTFRISFNNKPGWAHSEHYFQLFQNRLTHQQFITSNKKRESFSIRCFLMANHLPPVSDEDSIVS